MAVSKVPQGCTLGIKVQTGVNSAGNPTYKTIHFSNVKTSATDADIFAIGAGMGALQKNPLTSLARVDTSDLINA